MTWVVVSVAVVVAIALTGCAYGSAARPACADAVLDDWTKGTLDASHSPECYEAAIDALPEDLRAYTTAADDIGRMAISATRSAGEIVAGTDGSARQLAARDVAGNDTDQLRAFPTEVALLVVVLAILAAAGVAAALVRRRRGQ